VDQLKRELVRRSEPVFEALACQGVGVFDTLKRQVLLGQDNATKQSQVM